VIGVDADPGMLAEGARRAAAAGITNVRWRQARAEELPGDLGPFRVVTFGQSFHWMDRDRVATLMLSLLAPGGAFVHVSDVKEEMAQPSDLPHPMPPYSAMRELIRTYLGPVQRAGQGYLRYGSPSGEDEVLQRAGFAPRQRLRIAAGGVMERTADDLVAWVYSHSGSAPHLFGARQAEFERDLRQLLRDASATGLFSEQPPDTEVFIWRKPL
jgi:hypothetical protein